MDENVQRTCPNCKNPVGEKLQRCPTCGMRFNGLPEGNRLTGSRILDAICGLIIGTTCMFGLWWLGPTVLRTSLGAVGFIVPIAGFLIFRNRYPAFARGFLYTLVLFGILIAVGIAIALGALVYCIVQANRPAH